MVLLKKLLNNLAFHSPAILSSEEGERYHKEFEILLSLGVLKQDTFPQERWCPSCESESLPIQTVSKERAYTLCTVHEEATRDYFDPQTVKQWRFTTPPFITLFLKTLGINQTIFTETVVGLIWDLGTHEINGNQYHLFFTRNIAEIEEDKHPIFTNMPNTAVFYLGTVHTALPDGIWVVPLLDTIKDINSEGLVINHKTLNSYLSDTTTSSQKDDQLLKCGKLQINLSQGVIQYSDKNSVEISPDDKKVRFLVGLVESKKVVGYAEIAKNTDMSCWHERVKNEDVKREVQLFKKDVRKFLVKVGMTNKEVESMIINKRNIGYKLHCAI